MRLFIFANILAQLVATSALLIPRVRVTGTELQVSTASHPDTLLGSSRPTVTVGVRSSISESKEPIDYSHVHEQRNPTEWTTSVSEKRDVVYSTALQDQIEMIRKLGMKEVEIEEEFQLQFSQVKEARIANMQFEGDRFRKVRMTYFDAGPNVQVSCWHDRGTAFLLNVLILVILLSHHYYRYSMLYGCPVMSTMCLC